MKNLQVSTVRIILIGLFAIYCIVCYGGNITINVVPDHDDWVYNTGENAAFKVSISGDIANSFSVSYEIGPEKMPAWKNESFNRLLKNSLSMEEQ